MKKTLDITTTEPETFKDFTKHHSLKDLKNNYKKIVREFSELEKGQRKVKPPIIIDNHVLLTFHSFEDYKAMAAHALSQPFARKDDVINTLLDKYINKPLKETKSDASKIYDNLIKGTNHFMTGNKFLYYSRELAVEELIKFENYLINDCKEEPKKNDIQLADFFYNLKDKEKFLIDLRNTFQDKNDKGKQFSILMYLLKDEKVLSIGDRKFATFHRLAKKYFIQNIGSSQSINDYYKHTETEKSNFETDITIISKRLKPLISKYKTPTT